MELEEVLMVNHGDQNDTIVTVGRKVACPTGTSPRTAI
jgi:hypothetical protein